MNAIPGKWILILLLLLPPAAFGSENCATQFNGVCKDSCGQHETPAEGAFIDCTEKEECCIEKPTSVQSATGSGEGNKKLEPGRPQETVK